MMILDVVCGMLLDEATGEWIKTEYGGEEYFFCTQLCKVQFESDPEKYSSDEWRKFLEEREQGNKE